MPEPGSFFFGLAAWVAGGIAGPVVDAVAGAGMGAAVLMGVGVADALAGPGTPTSPVVDAVAMSNGGTTPTRPVFHGMGSTWACTSGSVPAMTAGAS